MRGAASGRRIVCHQASSIVINRHQASASTLASPLPPATPPRQISPMSPALHLALAQFKPRKGDYAANLERVRDIFGRVVALDPRPTVLHLPETALTGYFVEGGVRDLAVTGGTLARDLSAAYRDVAGGGPPLDVVVGFYEVFESTLYNSAMYVTLHGRGRGTKDEGRGASDPGYVVRHVHRKNFLPTYGLF